MHTTKVVCECKNIDWNMLDEERKIELRSQLSDQLEIITHPSALMPFYLISKETISSKFVNFLEQKIREGANITIVDPSHLGQFEKLYMYEFDENT